jgi:hypothetical protein
VIVVKGPDLLQAVAQAFQAGIPVSPAVGDDDLERHGAVYLAQADADIEERLLGRDHLGLPGGLDLAPAPLVGPCEVVGGRRELVELHLPLQGGRSGPQGLGGQTEELPRPGDLLLASPDAIGMRPQRAG